ncbi:hypothetical protein [Thalassobellus citreus]|uniref:hypothetical protein n=1 Tax=Thalassobellus citreus TaxID=3367752 RepID=UPI0037B8E9BB
MRILEYWAILSFLGIIIIKTIIRPKHFYISDTFDFLQGTLPNFFAGSGLFVLAFVFFRAFFTNQNSIIKRVIFAFTFSFLGLTIWEFTQFFMGFPIDYYDILMTAIGNSFSIIIVLLIRIR